MMLMSCPVCVEHIEVHPNDDINTHEMSLSGAATFFDQMEAHHLRGSGQTALYHHK